jgi:hypothetical protein
MKKAEKPAQATATKGKKPTRFTDVEKAAMQQRAKELKADERGKKARADGESEVRAAIAEMQESDRAMATRLHEIVTAASPDLSPKTWYGMPAYVNKEGKIICFFQPAQKFKTRYATFGFNDSAHLDDGNFWPVAYALHKLTAADEAKITALVKKAVK